MVDGEVEMAIFSYLGLMDLTTDLPVYTFHIKSNVVCKGRMLRTPPILFSYTAFLIKQKPWFLRTWAFSPLALAFAPRLKY